MLDSLSGRWRVQYTAEPRTGLPASLHPQANDAAKRERNRSGR
jgi:hypothetical protein